MDIIFTPGRSGKSTLVDTRVAQASDYNAAFASLENETVFEVGGRQYSTGFYAPRVAQGDVFHEWIPSNPGLTLRVGKDYYYCCPVVRERPGVKLPISTSA